MSIPDASSGNLKPGYACIVPASVAQSANLASLYHSRSHPKVSASFLRTRFKRVEQAPNLPRFSWRIQYNSCGKAALDYGEQSPF